jgi:hypothetical protein
LTLKPIVLVAGLAGHQLYGDFGEDLTKLSDINIRGGKILMTTNETREPTLAEIMEEIKKSRDEVVKNIEISRLAMWLTPVAVASSLALFGLGQIRGVPLSDWQHWWVGALDIILGVVMIIYFYRGLKRAGKRLEEKWYKAPRKA